MRPGRPRLPRPAWRPLAALPLLALLLAPLPVASAQGPLDIQVDVAPFAEPIAPLNRALATTLAIDAPCRVPGGDLMHPRVNLWLSDVPSWAVVAISPSFLTLDLQRCEGGRIREAGALVATTTAAAPAFTPATFRVHVSYEGASPNVTGTDEVTVTASWFSILDVRLDDPIVEVNPGETARFPIHVENLGNDRVSVQMELVEASPGLTPILPGPATLESLQKGGSPSSTTFTLEVRASEEKSFSNTAGVVVLRLRSHHADRPDLPGDVTTLSVVVDVMGFRVSTPGPAPLAAPLLAGLLLLAARRLRS